MKNLKIMSKIFYTNHTVQDNGLVLLDHGLCASTFR